MAGALTVPTDSKGDPIDVHTAAYSGDVDTVNAYVTQGGDVEVKRGIKVCVWGGVALFHVWKGGVQSTISNIACFCIFMAVFWGFGWSKHWDRNSVAYLTLWL